VVCALTACGLSWDLCLVVVGVFCLLLISGERLIACSVVYGKSPTAKVWFLTGVWLNDGWCFLPPFPSGWGEMSARVWMVACG